MQLIGSLLAGDCSSDTVWLLCNKLNRIGQERTALMIMEGFRNNRSRSMQDFMG